MFRGFLVDRSFKRITAEADGMDQNICSNTKGRIRFDAILTVAQGFKTKSVNLLPLCLLKEWLMAKRIHDLIEDTELFGRLAQGDEQAFELIFHHYNRRLYPFVLNMVRSEETAKELVQDVFVHLWLKRELLADVQHPTSYLFNIASNRTLNFLKQVNTNARLMDQLAAGATELSYQTEERLAFRETAGLVDTAVSQLPKQRKRIWEMSRYEGFSHDEIAQRLGLSKETVKKQIGHAMRYIRRYLADRGSVLSLVVFLLLAR